MCILYFHVLRQAVGLLEGSEVFVSGGSHLVICAVYICISVIHQTSAQIRTQFHGVYSLELDWKRPNGLIMKYFRIIITIVVIDWFIYRLILGYLLTLFQLLNMLNKIGKWLWNGQELRWSCIMLSYVSVYPTVRTFWIASNSAIFELITWRSGAHLARHKGSHVLF
jgi:hypothetical protein